MQKRQQALQEVGCANHPTLRQPDPLSAHNVDAFNYRLLGRRSTSMNLLGKGALVDSNSLVAPRVRMAGLLRGPDALNRSKAGREKGNHVNAQHSSKIVKSQTVSCE
jgi:hypothetical protein